MKCDCKQWGCITCMGRYVGRYYANKRVKQSKGRTHKRIPKLTERELTLRALATFGVVGGL